MVDNAPAGFISFDRVQDAMKAEKFLNAAGIGAKAVVPPHHLDSACNMGVTFDLSCKTRAEQVLIEKRIKYDYLGPLAKCR